MREWRFPRDPPGGTTQGLDHSYKSRWDRENVILKIQTTKYANLQK